MKRGLSSGLILGYLVFGLLCFLIILLLPSRIVHQYLLDKYSRELYDEAYYLASSCVVYKKTGSFDVSELSEKVDTLLSCRDGGVLVVSRGGEVLYDSSSLHTGALLENYDPAETGSQIYELGTHYGLYSETMVSVSVPVTGNFTTYGYVVLLLPLSEVTADENTFVGAVILTVVFLYLCSFVFLLWYQLRISVPLQKITRAAGEYASGNLAYRFTIPGTGEFSYLADTLNYMAYELSSTEESQKKFISNISHDFRSPLTSIKGYLEAMLDGTIPPELYEKYMKLVVQEAERLTMLTERTLSLKSLESDGSLLDLESFDINGVIKDTALAFEGACARRQIVFDLTFSAERMYVRADKSKIQQVLYNLIDNAIKFSSEKSVIWIEVYDRYERVFVSVKDSGCGIPRRNQKKIWTRFYKADHSRGKDKQGTGLGLAICRDIIMAHNQNIDVISTEGVGSEFIFTLSRAQEE